MQANMFSRNIPIMNTVIVSDINSMLIAHKWSVISIFYLTQIRSFYLYSINNIVSISLSKVYNQFKEYLEVWCPMMIAIFIMCSFGVYILNFNSLAPGKFQFNFRQVIFKLTLLNGGWGISHEISVRWMPQYLNDIESTLVQVMAWCRQAASHYPRQCWPRSMSKNAVTRPQWVNCNKHYCRSINMYLVRLSISQFYTEYFFANFSTIIYCIKTFHIHWRYSRVITIDTFAVLKNDCISVEKKILNDAVR